MYKDDIDYTRMRLNNTVVRHNKGFLVLVKSIRFGKKGFEIVVDKLEGNLEGPLRVCVEELNLSSPPLGNVDYLGLSLYVSRVPKRNDWRQGLRSENLCYIHKGKTTAFRDLPYNILKMAIFNRYASYRCCSKVLEKKEIQSMSFSRNFSLDIRHQLWYKNRMVVGGDDNGTPKLNAKYTWLKEALGDATK